MQSLDERVAVISDVHGNIWALEATLADIDILGVDRVVNLGDAVYGPLEPGATAGVLMERGIITVRGNEDRIVTEGVEDGAGDPTVPYVRAKMDDAQLSWLRALPKTRLIGAEFYLCHGTPDDDTTYLLREVGPGSVSPRSPDQLERMLSGVESGVILCGHDHRQAETVLPSGKLVLNPGSVGLQAYSDEHPYPHSMSAGTPHARYSVLTRSASGWRFERRAVGYGWETAAAAAARRGRSDWEGWLRLGRA